MKHLVAYLLLAVISISHGQSFSHLGEQVQVTQVADSFRIPWAMSFISAHEMLVSERRGKLFRLDIQSGKKTEISGLPDIWASGQGGLMDVIASNSSVASDGSTNNSSDWIYFSYSKPHPKDDDLAATTVARAKLNNDQLSDWQDLLVTQSFSSGGRHFGSRLALVDDYLFITVGDRGDRDSAQDLSSHNGSVLRLHTDGSIPTDNPYVNSADALAEIYSHGHRNPQGIAYDKSTQRLLVSEHGPRGGDEINIVTAGKNYGWPIVSHGKEYWGPISVGEATSKAGMVDPIKVYVPSIAPSSLMVYQGKAFPTWQGSLLLGSLKLTHLNHLHKEAEHRLFDDLGQRIRSLTTDNKGNIYFATDRGNIFQLKPAS